MPSLMLTSSRVGSYLACPRRHQWAYEWGIRPDRPGARLSLGTAFHKGLETLNTGGSVDDATLAARSPEMDELDREKAACLVLGWEWRWREAPAFKKILAVEQVFEFRPVKGTRWTYAGKIDAIGELEDGSVGVAEYKSASEDLAPTSDYWRRLLIDRQISGYILGARALGYPADRVLYDAARVPAIKPRLLSRKKDSDGERESPAQYAERLTADIGERPDWYYGRQEIPRLDSDLEDARADMAHFAALILHNRRVGRWPRNTDACKRWGTCAYFGPCADNYDPERQGLPTGYRKVDDVNQELLQQVTIEGEPSDNGIEEPATA